MTLTGAIRRVVGRVPPHLRGRIPADCGEGRIAPDFFAEDGAIRRSTPTPAQAAVLARFNGALGNWSVSERDWVAHRARMAQQAPSKLAAAVTAERAAAAPVPPPPPVVVSKRRPETERLHAAVSRAYARTGEVRRLCMPHHVLRALLAENPECIRYGRLVLGTPVGDFICEADS